MPAEKMALDGPEQVGTGRAGPGGDRGLWGARVALWCRRALLAAGLVAAWRTR